MLKLLANKNDKYSVCVLIVKLMSRENTIGIIKSQGDVRLSEI